MEQEIAQAERDLRSIQTREERAITLFVSGRITEAQLDDQRKLITERLESVRAKLDEYRARAASEAEKLRLVEAVFAWARDVGQGLDELTPEQRKQILQMVGERSSSTGTTTWTSRSLYPLKVSPLRRIP